MNMLMYIEDNPLLIVSFCSMVLIKYKISFEASIFPFSKYQGSK